MRTEIKWKPVKGYEGLYEVSSVGEVRKTGGELIPTRKENHGYLRVDLRKDGKRRCGVLVHRIVAEAFIPNPDNLPQINHKDHNGENNSVDNLEWCNASYNSNYDRKTNVRNIRTIGQYTMDGKEVDVWENGGRIEDALGYDRRRVFECCRGIRKSYMGFIWKYV